MPRYYFHLHNDVVAEDEEGTDLPDIDAARQKAVEHARYMTATSVLEQGRINLRHRIDVADQHGTVVATTTFGEVVEIEA